MEVALLPAAASSVASSVASSAAHSSAASSSSAPAVSSCATRGDFSCENIDHALREALARALKEATMTPSDAVLAATATTAAVDVPSVTSDLGPSPWGRPPQGWSEAQTSHVPCQTRPSTAVPTQAARHLPRGTQRVARPPQAQATVPKCASVPQPLQPPWVQPTVVAPKAPPPQVPGRASSAWLEAPAVPNDAGITGADADHGFPPPIEEILERLHIDQPARRALWLLHMAKPTESMRILFKAMRKENFLANPSAFVSRCIDTSFEMM